MGKCPIEAMVPYVKEKREMGQDWPIVGHTMVGHRRLENIEGSLRSVVSRQIEGHFVELGVWKGGASIYARMVLNVLEQRNRTVFVLDAFETLEGYDKAQEFISTTEAELRHNFQKYDVSDGVEYMKGLFQHTTPRLASKLKNEHGHISVLRIDGNFYFSYEDAMYNLYELVPVGGIVIFDDMYSHPDVKRFWHDFTSDYKLPEMVHPIDKNSAWFMKIKPVVLDPKRKRGKPHHHLV